MPAALWKLLGLKFRATVRYSLRNIKTVRGAFFFLFGIGMLALWLGPSLWTLGAHRSVNIETVRAFAPLLMLGMCISNLFLSNQERSVHFSPAEIAFLFAGPFTRRQLLLYKICGTLSGALFGALLMSLVFLRFLPWWPAAYVGTVMALLFIQLFSIMLALAIQAITERTYTRLRKIALIVILGALGIAIWHVLQRGQCTSLGEFITAFRSTRTGTVLLIPFDVFGRLMTTRSAGPLLLWTLAAAATNGMMLSLVLWLDTNYYEGSIALSSRSYRRAQQRRRTGIAWQPRGTAKWTLPRLPFWGGAGPIAWKQLTSVFRRLHGVLFLLALMAVIATPTMMFQRNAKGLAELIIIGNVLLLLTLMSTQSLTYDFRGDIDNMSWLKGLPLSSLSIAAGQLVVPVVFMTLVHWLLLVLTLLFSSSPTLSLLLIGAVALPFNLLYFGFENMMFLLFPFRLVSATPGDFQLFGRNLIMLIARLLMILLAALLAISVGALAYYIGGGNQTAWIIVSWITFFALALAVVPAVAWAFQRFDVSTHTPL